MIGVSVSTLKRDWRCARAWLASGWAKLVIEQRCAADRMTKIPRVSGLCSPRRSNCRRRNAAPSLTPPAAANPRSALRSKACWLMTRAWKSASTTKAS